ncbi:MAG: hypothetical protein JRG97_06115 [Deltaproteobacteria bacterium]|nr:hypothetical protein [Deltaproteobacteria bacterium]MBW2140632.1 hypothetical protein [Deltaproteobacteria bacterium]
MALDEPQETDEKLDYDGVTYMIDKALLDQVKKVNIDFIDQGMRSGFSITPANPLDSGPSACGTSCSC